MPFYFEGGDGEPRGILVDIWGSWSRKTGVRVEFSLLPWREVMEQVSHGRVDINPLMYKSDERSREFLFSTPLVNLSTFSYLSENGRLKTSNADLDGVGGLRGLLVGVVARDYTGAYLAEHLPDLELLSLSDHEALVKAAMAGQVDTFIMEAPVASTYLSMHNKETYTISFLNSWERVRSTSQAPKPI